MCDTCLYMSSVSILVLIHAVQRLLQVFYSLLFLLALTHGALLSCVFLFCFVFTMSSYFLDFMQNSLQLELKVSSPREDLPSLLPDDWNPFLSLGALGIQLST